MKLIVCKKVKFANEETARFSLTKIQATSKRKIVPVRFYQCKYCNSWHLTSRVDSFEVQKENDALKLQVAELQKQIAELKSKDGHLIKLKLRKDERIIEQEKHILKLRKENKELREYLNTLLGKLNSQNK